jgi:heme A synthase
MVLVGLAALRHGRARVGLLLIALPAVQLTLGWAAVAMGLSLTAVLLHNLAAAALLAALAWLV